MPRKKYWKKGRHLKKNTNCPDQTPGSEKCENVTFGSSNNCQSLTFGSSETCQNLTFGSSNSCSEQCGINSTKNCQTFVSPNSCDNQELVSKIRLNPHLESCSSLHMKSQLKPMSNMQFEGELNHVPSEPEKPNTSSKLPDEGAYAGASETSELNVTVQGSFHQGDAKFGDNAGKQCVANSCVSILYNKVKNVCSWGSVDLDRILQEGNKLYSYIRHTLGVKEMYLLVSELPKTLDLFEKTFSTELGESLTGFVSDDISIHFDCDFLMSMGDALESSLTKFDACFITFAMSTFAVIKRNKEFYVFDSHSRSISGMQIHDGKSGVMKYTSIGEIQNHCKKLASSMNISPNTQFEVTGISVEVVSDLPTTEQAMDDPSMSESDEVSIVSTERIGHPFQTPHPSSCMDLCSKLGLVCQKENLRDQAYTRVMGPPCKTQAISMDGNCFFRALSFSISGTENNHRKVRLAVVKHLSNNPEKYIPYLRQPFVTTEDYIRVSRMKYLSTWATEVEIQAAADMLGMDIYTYTTTWLKYSTKLKQGGLQSSGAIYLKLRECHYEVVLCVNQSDENQRACTPDCFSGVDTLLDEPHTTADELEVVNDTLSHTRKRNVAVPNINTKTKCKNERQCRKRKRDYQRFRRDTVKLSKNNIELRHVKENLKRKAKYHEDVEYRNRKRVCIRRRYASDEHYKHSLKSSSIARYKHNPEHREYVKGYSIDKYKNDSEHKERVKTYNIEKYAKKPFYRERVKQRSMLKYKKSSVYRQNKKLRNAETRAQKQRDRNKINKVTSIFNTMKYEAPDHICCVCHRRLFAKQVMNCRKDSYAKKGMTVKHLAEKCISDKYLHTCTNDCSNNCVLKNSAIGKFWICFTCHRKIMAGKMPAEAAVNNLDLEPIPDELESLNSLERHLIALHIPFSKLMSLPRGSQHGVHGPVVCVPSDVQKTVNALPRIEDDDFLIRVKLKRKLSFKGHAEFKFVKTKRIKKALRFLKQNNKLYANVSFNEKWKNPHCADVEEKSSDTGSSKTVPDITEKGDTELEPDDNDTGMYMDSCLQPVDIGQEVLDQHFENVLCVAPAENNDPVKVLMDESNEAKSFPVLFPSGSPTYHDDREARITIARYLHTRLMLADSRFAKSTDYIFYAQYLSEVYQVLSSVSIALRKTFCKALGPKVEAKDLLDREMLQKLLKNDNAYKFLKPIRGTPAFWQSAQKDLFAMLRQLGIPTWFASFSAGDTRWPEILETLQREEGDTRNLDDLDWCEKCSLLRRNPVTAARMFDHRFHCFLKEVILSPAEPIGNIIDYFYRVEFQQRGSPHVHCLFWAEDAPKLDENTDEEIATFVDKYVCCGMPDENDPQLHEIVNSVQKHSTRHSKSCRKKGTKCRFNFPRPPSSRTFISRPLDEEDKTNTEPGKPVLPIKSEGMRKEEAKAILAKIWNVIEQPETNIESVDELFREIGINQELFEEACNKITRKPNVVLRRQPKDVWVNQYNADLLRCWDANMDIQYIIDAYSCVVYIISYISKAEREMGLLLDQARKESLTGNENAKEAMKKLGSVYLHNREVSAQEAVFRVCNLRLKECSRKVLFVPTGENPVKMSLPIDILRNKSKGEDLDPDDIFMTSSVDRYRNRPENDEFNSLCLASFCSEYRLLAESEVSGDENKTHKNPVHVLSNGVGHVQKRSRTSPAIIRYVRFPVAKEPEKYYQSMLQLFLPYRSESQLKPGGFETFQNFYETGAVKCGSDNIELVKDIVERNKAKFEISGEEIDIAEKILENTGPLEDAWAQICPETEQERLACLNTSNQNTSDSQDDTDIPDLADDDNKKSAVEIRQQVPTRNEAQTLLRSLNVKQRNIFYTVRDWCLKKAGGNDPEPQHICITGGAGTGKSHLIKCIQYEASRIFAPTLSNPDDTSVLLTAPTGVAAFNINAGTIHSTFAIGVDSKLPYQPLGDEKINSLRTRLGSLQILIIDEISMVDQKLFAYIHGRLRQIKQRRDFYPFAKVSILAVGDFYQLPPVKGKPLYAENGGLNLWTDLFKIAELTEVMRQKNEDFAHMLNRLRKHKRSEPLKNEDIVTLRKCETGEESDALHICATNKEVDEYNLTKLMSLCSDLVTIEAEDFYRNAKSGKMEKRESQYIRVFNTNLARRVTLAVGARVMLTKNIDVSDGLVNGVFGSVSYIAQSDGVDFPSIVYVVFDNTEVGKKQRIKQRSPPYVPENSTSVLPQEDRVTNSGGLRRQFPLKLAFACSIHKIQGSTLNQVVVSLDKVFAAGQAYVALSRVTSLDGLIIQNFKESSIYCNEKVEEAMKSLPALLSTDSGQKRQEEATCSLLLHNIQGLKSHSEDIKCDSRFMDSTFICLTETWLSPTDPQGFPKLDNFTFHHRPRQACYDHSSEICSDLSHQSHGGVGIYYKTNVHCEILNLGVPNLEHIVIYTTDADIVVGVIYRPSSYKIETFRQQLRHLLDELEKFQCGCIVMGDFNENVLRWSSVADMMAEYDFIQYVNHPTTEGGTLIDHVYGRRIGDMTVRVIPTYYSYHEAILVQLSCP